MATAYDQICFTNETNCPKFHGHIFKANICDNCTKDVAKHSPTSVDEADLIKALEFTQKGEKTPSLILEADNSFGCLYLGGYKAAINSDFIQQQQVKAIVNTVGKGLFQMFGKKFQSTYDSVISGNEIACLTFDWVDSVSQNITDEELEKVVKFIHDNRKNNAGVLVHCAQGKSRSTTAVVAYIMAALNLSASDAFKLVQNKRKMAEPNSHFLYLLHQFEGSNSLKQLRVQLNEKT